MAAGTVAGLTLPFTFDKVTNHTSAGSLAMFVVWQTAVLVSLFAEAAPNPGARA